MSGYAYVRNGSIATVSRCPRYYVRFSCDSDQIADVPTRRIKCAPAARETACEPQVHPCAEQRSRTSRTRAPVALTDPSEPWWTKPIRALQLQGLSWACDHRPWSCERILYSLHRWVFAVLHLDPVRRSSATIGTIDALRHHSLESHIAGSAKQFGADLALFEWRDENAVGPSRE